MSCNSLPKTCKLYFGYSEDDFIRYNAASGGIVTSLFLYMLEADIVDKVLVVKMMKFTSHPMLTSNRDEILSAQGSVYFKTFSLAILLKLVFRIKQGERVSVVGLPCQISMLRKILKELGLEKRVFFVGLIRNHENERWYLWHVLSKHLPKNTKPLAIGSRKGGWPGGIEVDFETDDGNFQKLIVPFILDFWGLFPSLNLSALLGCLICTDHLASEADIVLGDAWHPKYVGKDRLGTSIILTRTDKGRKLIELAVKNKRLYVEEAQLRDLLITQSRNIIETSQYAPFKQKLLQHRIEAVREFKEIDKTILAILLLINHYMIKMKFFR